MLTKNNLCLINNESSVVMRTKLMIGNVKLFRVWISLKQAGSVNLRKYQEGKIKKSNKIEHGTY